MAEALQSDDEGTLVEAPRPKASSKRKPVVAINYDNDDESIPGNNTADAEPSLLLKSSYNYQPTKDASLNRVQAKKRAEARKGKPDEGDVFLSVRSAAKISTFNRRSDILDQGFSNTGTFKTSRNQ